MFWILGHVLVLASCSDSLQNGLRFAGDNAAELQSVLEMYEAEGDGVKMAAAEFLIGKYAAARQQDERSGRLVRRDAWASCCVPIDRMQCRYGGRDTVVHDSVVPVLRMVVYLIVTEL